MSRCPPCTHNCDEGRAWPSQPTAATLRGWFLEFESDGRPYVWNGLAYSEKGAENLARHCLAVEDPTFHERRARLVACIER